MKRSHRVLKVTVFDPACVSLRPASSTPQRPSASAASWTGCWSGAGTGKSVLVGDELSSSDPEKYTIKNISFNCCSTSAMFRVCLCASFPWPWKQKCNFTGFWTLTDFCDLKQTPMALYSGRQLFFVPSLSLQSVVLIFITPHHVTSWD